MPARSIGRCNTINISVLQHASPRPSDTKGATNVAMGLTALHYQLQLTTLQDQPIPLLHLQIRNTQWMEIQGVVGSRERKLRKSFQPSLWRSTARYEVPRGILRKGGTILIPDACMDLPSVPQHQKHIPKYPLGFPLKERRAPYHRKECTLSTEHITLWPMSCW